MEKPKFVSDVTFVEANSIKKMDLKKLGNVNVQDAEFSRCPETGKQRVIFSYSSSGASVGSSEIDQAITDFSSLNDLYEETMGSREVNAPVVLGNIETIVKIVEKRAIREIDQALGR